MALQGQGDVELHIVEGFCFVDPFFNGVWDCGHGEDHGGNLFVKTSRELSAGSELVFKLCFSS